MARFKLDGLRWNNIDLSAGLPEHVKARAVAAHKATPRAIPAQTARVGDPIYNYLYVAQHNFVDDEPTAVPFSPNPGDVLQPVPDVGVPLPLLPGYPMSQPAAPLPIPDPPTRVHVAGSNVKDLINAATGAPAAGGLWTAVTYNSAGDMLTSFTRNTGLTSGNRIYRSIGQTVPLGDSETIYEWSGWGITYYTGLFRPALFSQYPPLSIVQQPVVWPDNIFVIDYTKTEIIFSVAENGEVHLIHGEILS
jgi:hypothetical protein